MSTTPTESRITDAARNADARIRARLADETKGFELDEGDKLFLLRACRIALEKHFSGEKVEPSQFGDVPERVARQSPRLFVSLYCDGKVRGCRSAQAGDMLSSALRSTQQAAKDDRLGGRIQRSELDRTLIDITVLLDPEPVDNTDGNLPRGLELGVHSLSVEQNGRSAFFKSSVPITKNYSLGKTLTRLSRKAGLEPDAYEAPQTTVKRYPTVQFAENFVDRFTQPAVRDFYRGTPLVHQSEVDRASLERALRLAAHYFTIHTTAKGRLTYQFMPKTGERVYSNAAAAVLRRTAATWIMAELARRLRDRRLLRAARRSIDYLIANHYQTEPENGIGYLAVKGVVNIGLAGFAALALVALDEPELEEKRDALGRFILSMEDRAGGYLAPVYLPNRSDATDPKHHYYPGEAMTALMKLSEATGDTRYSDVVARVFPFYRDFYRATDQRVNMAAWMSKPYAALFEATGDRQYADFVLEINDMMVTKQYGLDHSYIDQIGGFSRKGVTYSAGVFLESVAEGLAVARHAGDGERIERYSESLLLGMRFLLQSQYTPAGLLHHPHRERSLGGYRTGFFEPTVRIDNVQHAVCAQIRALDTLELRY